MVHIIDTTLREGEQAPGVVFDITTKQAIIRDLVAMGVDEIELGIATASNKGLESLVCWMGETFPKQSFSLWCRCREEDIRLAARLCPPVLALSIPASDLHLHRKMGRDRAWAKKQLLQALGLAFALGIPKVALGLEDATRADSDFVKELAVLAATANCFRLRLADTVGVASPGSMAELLHHLSGCDLELGVHCHNDFGMATANTIASFENGAQWADVTALGLGERAGNSRLEEVVSYLVLQLGMDKYNLGSLRHLSLLVAGAADRSIGPARPILGDSLFTCETGLHLQGIMAEPATYEPFDPECIGAKRRLLIGAKSGRRSIAGTLKRLKLPSLDDQRLVVLTSRIRSLARELKRPLADHEIIKLALRS